MADTYIPRLKTEYEKVIRPKLTEAFGYSNPYAIPAITKVVLNYARETITVAGSGLDLGTFVQGGNAVTVAIGIGSDAREVKIRMARKGGGLKY